MWGRKEDLGVMNIHLLILWDKNRKLKKTIDLPILAFHWHIGKGWIWNLSLRRFHGFLLPFSSKLIFMVLITILSHSILSHRLRQAMKKAYKLPCDVCDGPGPLITPQSTLLHIQVSPPLLMLSVLRWLFYPLYMVNPLSALQCGSNPISFMLTLWKVHQLIGQGAKISIN